MYQPAAGHPVSEADGIQRIRGGAIAGSPAESLGQLPLRNADPRAAHRRKHRDSQTGTLCRRARCGSLGKRQGKETNIMMTEKEIIRTYRSSPNLHQAIKDLAESNKSEAKRS